MKNVLIVDGNSIGYAAQNTRPLTCDGREVQSIFQTFKMLKSLREELPDYDTIFWLWDGRAQWRFNLYPDYKGNRSDTPEKLAIKEKYQSCQPDIRRGLKALGINQFEAPNFEADDLAGYFVRLLEPKGCKIKLITGDEDWIQLVSRNVSWLDPRVDPPKQCNVLNFREMTGVSTTAQFLEMKALQGDTSDNISPVGGLGPTAAAAIAEEFGSVAKLFEHYKTHGEFDKSNTPASLSRFCKKLNDLCKSNYKLFTRNYRLMNLASNQRDEQIKADIRLTPGKLDMEDFEALCSELRFMSILRELSRWETTFAKRQ